MAAGGVVLIPYYATLGRMEVLADGVAEMLAPPCIRYGATKYTILRSRDDPSSVRLWIWWNNKDDWYRYWEGEEAIEFRARYSGRYQVPVTYVWHDEIGSERDVPGASAEVTPDVEIVS